MSAKYDFVIEQGTDFNIELTYEVDDKLVDFTGFKGIFIIKSQEYGGSTLKLTTENGGIVMDSFGKINIIPSKSILMAAKWRMAFYQFDIQDPDGTTRRMLEGMLYLKKSLGV